MRSLEKLNLLEIFLYSFLSNVLWSFSYNFWLSFLQWFLLDFVEFPKKFLNFLCIRGARTYLNMVGTIQKLFQFSLQFCDFYWYVPICSLICLKLGGDQSPCPHMFWRPWNVPILPRIYWKTCCFLLYNWLKKMGKSLK